MKAIIYSGIFLCLLNLAIGLIVSSFGALNLVVSTLIIALTAVLMLAVSKWIALKDAFRVSLSFIIPVIGVVQYLLSVFMPSQASDNWFLIGILLFVTIEGVLIIGANTVSNKIQ